MTYVFTALVFLVLGIIGTSVVWAKYHADVKHGLQVALSGAQAEVEKLRTDTADRKASPSP